MDFAASQLTQLLHSVFCHGVGGGGDGQGDQRFVGMEPGVSVAQMGHLQMLDGVQSVLMLLARVLSVSLEIQTLIHRQQN